MSQPELRGLANRGYERVNPRMIEIQGVDLNQSKQTLDIRAKTGERFSVLASVAKDHPKGTFHPGAKVDMALAGKAEQLSRMVSSQMAKQRESRAVAPAKSADKGRG